MAYSSRDEERKALNDLRSGKVDSIPCTECENGRISGNPQISNKIQCVFYCNKCKAKIIFN